MKRLNVLAVLTVAILFNGCESAGTATTQPSPTAVLVTSTTAGDEGLDLIVQTVQIALDLKILDGPTYWRDVDPGITAGQAALHTMQDHASKAYAAEKAGDAATATDESAAAGVARDALLAAVRKLRPLSDALQSKGAVKTPTTTKAK